MTSWFLSTCINYIQCTSTDPSTSMEVCLFKPAANLTYCMFSENDGKKIMNILNNIQIYFVTIIIVGRGENWYCTMLWNSPNSGSNRLLEEAVLNSCGEIERVKQSQKIRLQFIGSFRPRSSIVTLTGQRLSLHLAPMTSVTQQSTCTDHKAGVKPHMFLFGSGSRLIGS